MAALCPPAPVTLASRAELERALEALERVRADLVARERGFESVVEEIPPAARPSARNLIHYLGLRAHELGWVQRVLAAHGLSSLGRAEPHVLSNLDAVLRALRLLTGRTGPCRADEVPAITFEQGEELRRARADALFGPARSGHPVRIMVTLPGTAAAEPTLLRDLLAGGMDCVRINCAHDGPDTWLGMLDNLRRARDELGRSCTVLMDLPGPRVRTGDIEPGPGVVKVHPLRDELGRVLRPARVWLAAGGASTPAPADAVLPLPAELLADLTPGDRLRFRDARGARRQIRIVQYGPGGVWGTLARTAYVRTGTVMRVARSWSGGDPVPPAPVGELPAVARKIRLRPGDTLVLTRAQTPGRPGQRSEGNILVEPARIPCTPPEALAHVRPGARVWLDDGHIGGVVSAVDDEGAHVRIIHAAGAGKLGAQKGVNFPGTDLGLAALTQYDLRILPFVGEHADLVGYSFVHSPADVRRLRDELARMGRADAGIILKIETEAAFQQLPMLLLEALRCRAAGVMIARGDRG